MDPLQQTAPQTPISSNATLSALTGILFFGPFVQRSMLSPEKGVAEGGGGSEANFIQGYCKVGKLNIVLFLITLSVYLINYFLQTAFLQRISSLTSLAICIISTFCIVACLNEIALQEIMPGVWPYPSMKDIALRPYTITKNLLHSLLEKWKKSDPYLP